MNWMKTFAASVGLQLAVSLNAIAGEVPTVLAKYFSEDKPVKAQLFTVIPPAEFEPFVEKLSEAARNNPEWFAQHSEKTPDGSPIPLYDEKLGMTQKEYDGFVKIWKGREFKTLAKAQLLLTEGSEGAWKINGTGPASSLSLLRYDGKANTFVSPNGTLEPIADLAAPADSLLGEWSGKEWRFLSENSLTTMKENVALGSTADGKYSILIYRLQEVTNKGRPLFDKSIMLRFAAKKVKK